MLGTSTNAQKRRPSSGSPKTSQPAAQFKTCPICNGSGKTHQYVLNFDDSLGQKDDATWRLDVVDWHHDHTKSTPGQPRYKNAFCYLACTMCVGDVTVTLDVRLYLRARTVRVINRKREPHKRIRFRGKNTILRQMLQRIAPLLPPDWAVIVQFDSW